MATGPDKYAGEHCKKVGLSIEQFYSASTRVRMTKISNIKKGLIYELSLMRKYRGMPWKDFYELDSFKVMVRRLEKRRNLLLRNKQKSEVDVLFDEPFCGVHREPVAEDDALSKERAKTEELTVKLQHLCVRNMNKRIKRRDLKIAESQALVNEMDRDRKSQDKTISKLEAQLHTAQSSVHCLRQSVIRSGIHTYKRMWNYYM